MTDTTNIFSQDIASPTLWSCQACDTDGICGFANENRTISPDTTPPSITILYPNGTIPYGYLGQNISLNYSISDGLGTLSSCWYDYNGTTNVTLPCDANSTIILTTKKNITIYANDSLNNLKTQVGSWDWNVFENSRVGNTTTYQTAKENYLINVTAGALLTSAKLWFDGTGYLATQSGDIWSYNQLVSSSASGNKSYHWEFIYNSESTNSTTSYQDINPIYLTECNSTIETKYLNVSFKDEIAGTAINASLTPISFNYYLYDSSSFKTYSLVNNTAHHSYAFCFSPINRTVTTNMTANYASTGYQLRSWTNATTLTNATTYQTLYLLANADGLYQTIIVSGTAGAAVAGATVTASNMYGVVDTRTTDSNGQVQLWLNPNMGHTITTTAAGYPTDVRVINPSTTTVYVSLTGTASIPSNVSITYTEGVTYTISPDNEFLYNNTDYNFQFNINHGTYTITNFGFTLYNSTGVAVASDSDTTNGGSTSVNYNVGNSTKITIVAFWTSNNTNNTVSYSWIVIETGDTDYSLLHFSEDLKTYIASGMFGLTTGFALNLICFVIILITTGVLSYKYSINNPFIISVIAAVLVAVLELGLGLIQMGEGKIPLTLWAALVVIGVGIKEAFS